VGIGREGREERRRRDRGQRETTGPRMRQGWSLRGAARSRRLMITAVMVIITAVILVE
jgi:hypothetical protein